MGTFVVSSEATWHQWDIDELGRLKDNAVSGNTPLFGYCPLRTSYIDDDTADGMCYD